jgi:glyoxylase-like metal-dependent hydrolase (beta-lactamase superfamily II)
MLDGGIAFAGDLFSTTGGAHIQRYFASDWRKLAQSARRLQQHRPELIYTGHGNQPMSGESLQALRFVSHSD